MPEHPWDAADKSYQLHHVSCGTCIGAGASPNTQTRCPEGQALWDAYNAAGMPPHLPKPRVWGVKPIPPGTTHDRNHRPA